MKNRTIGKLRRPKARPINELMNLACRMGRDVADELRREDEISIAEVDTSFVTVTKGQDAWLRVFKLSWLDEVRKRMRESGRLDDLKLKAGCTLHPDGKITCNNTQQYIVSNRLNEEAYNCAKERLQTLYDNR